MDEIKTSFDKIMEQFSDSVVHVAPKKLNFENLNDTFTNSIAKKRKLSPEKGDDISLKSSNASANGSDMNTSRESLNASISSPWETRRMKADLLEAKARILKLTQEIERHNTVRANTEILYTNKVSALQQQCDYTSNKVLDMEKHLNSLRKRENATKAENIKLKNQLNLQKQSYDDKLQELKRINSELETNSRHIQNRLSNELSELKRRLEKNKLESDMLIQELESTKITLQEYKEKALLYTELKSQHEVEMQQHEITKSKIKELQFELDSLSEWKELSKNTQARLTALPELEKEVNRLRQENKNLRDTIGNKLLLEEQVFDLQSRSEKYEKLNAEMAALKVHINDLEQENKEWRKIAEDHCLPKGAGINPSSLRSRIEQILQKDLILASEKGAAKTEKGSFKTQIQELQKQNEIYTKANNELKTALKHNKNIITRVQKKVLIIAKERDFYKQLLENYEKDLTISGSLIDTLNPDTQIRARLEMLEKTLNGYKEMCANLEKELALTKQNDDIPMDIPSTNESYEPLKKEIETLRIENDRLKRRKDELELELEHRCLKGDFNFEKFKVLHFKMNPAHEAYENSKNEIEKLQAEIERLKRKIRKLEDDREEMTSRLNDTANMTVNIKEMNCLRSKLESMEAKMQHIKEVYKSASLEFRDVCYMLFGYRVDRVGNTNYRISSMFAENEDDYLNFRLNESGVLDMLETDYSVSLNEMMRTHLAAHKCLPAFLSALTLELFNRTTIMVQ